MRVVGGRREKEDKEKDSLPDVDEGRSSVPLSEMEDVDWSKNCRLEECMVEKLALKKGIVYICIDR